jgi:hypothetical protein
MTTALRHTQQPFGSLFLADVEDHELGGLRRCDTDEADRTSAVDVVLRHGTAFGSNTARCVPSCIDTSKNMKSRRTFIYFHPAHSPDGACAWIGAWD